MPRRLPAMYQFGQDDIKFLVLRVKDHMKTDVLITGSPVLQIHHIFTSDGGRGLKKKEKVAFIKSNLSN